MDDFVIVYVDDILLYSKTAKKHVENFEEALGKLKDNNLNANNKKSAFA